MTTTAVLPFTLRRGSDVVRSLEVTSTAETIDGLVRLEAREFAAELNVRLAEHALPEAARDRQRLPGSSHPLPQHREG